MQSEELPEQPRLKRDIQIVKVQRFRVDRAKFRQFQERYNKANIIIVSIIYGTINKRIMNGVMNNLLKCPEYQKLQHSKGVNITKL